MTPGPTSVDYRRHRLIAVFVAIAVVAVVVIGGALALGGGGGSDSSATAPRSTAARSTTTTTLVQLGTNGTVNPDDVERMMQILKGVRRVVIVNVKVPRSWEDEVNQTLADGVKRYKNAVLADWHAAGGEHPEWLYDDGFHLRRDGALAYGQLIASKL